MQYDFFFKKKVLIFVTDLKCYIKLKLKISLVNH
jgi:hypothetical protein